MIRLLAHGVTDVGRVREGNEDGFRIDDRTGLVAVADGMGGHVGGEVASATALEALVAAVANGRPIREAIAEANEAVMEKSATDENLRGMGTTLTVATLASGGTLLIGHVGDSRAYLARDGAITQITDDHSLVEEMVQRGQLTPEQAEVHPRRSIVTRALGIDPDIEIDVYPVELRPGDRVLLCSDGLSNMLRSEAMAAILGREPDGQRAAQLLVDSANAAGGEDNITALIIDAVEESTTTRTAQAVDADIVDDDAFEGDDGISDFGSGNGSAPPARARRRVPVGRIFLWVLPIVAVLAIAFGAVGWYARRSYFVTVDAGRVTIFKGVSGGILGWDPTVERRTKLRPDELTPAQRSDLEDEKKFSSLDDAQRYIGNLKASIAERTPPSTTTTTPPTTTVPATVPPAPPPS